MSSTSSPHNSPSRLSPPVRSPSLSPSPAARERTVMEHAGAYHSLPGMDRLAIHGDDRRLAALQRPQPSRRTATDYLLETARRSRFAIQETPAMERAFARITDFIRNNHAKFLTAIHPDSTERHVAAQAIRDFLFKHNTGDVIRASKEALVDFVRVTAGPQPDEPYTSSKRDEVEFIKERLTWHPGQSLTGLLEPTRFTDCNHPKVVAAAHDILTAPVGPSRHSSDEPRALLHDILRQRYKGTKPGKPLVIRGLDGKDYTLPALLDHPRWGDLLIGDNLWNTLRDPVNRALLESSNGTFTHLTPDEEANLERFAMAQHIAAVVIHYAVRDSVKYGLGNWKKRASEVLRQPHASCSGSANLAAALARAVNIPAGSVYSWVHLPKYFFVVMSPRTLASRGRTSVHLDTGYVMLERTSGGFGVRTVRADPTDHIQLAEALTDVNYPATRPVDFNGARDSLLNFPAEFVFDVAGPINNIDPLLNKSGNIMPAAEERWQFIQYVASQLAEKPHLDPQRDIQKIAEDFADLAETMVVQEWAKTHETYETYVNAYNNALEGAFSDDAGVVLTGHLGNLVRKFFTTTDGIELARQHAHEPHVIRQAFAQFAAARGVPDTVLTARVNGAVSAVASHLNLTFLAIPTALHSEFSEAFDATGRYIKAMEMGQDTETRKGVWSRMHARNYTFMTRCYPVSEADAWGAAGFKQWMPRHVQDAYMAWLPRAKGLGKVFSNPETAALLYMLGDKRSQYFDRKTGTLTAKASEIIAREEIDVRRLQRFTDFHTHLLSNISMSVMNRFVNFGETEGTSIRRPEYGSTEFEAYLKRTNRTLWQLHDQEMEDHPFYPYAVYVNLLKLLPMSLLGPAHEALADFVSYVESGLAGPITSEADLDNKFAYFLGDKENADETSRVAIEAFESRVPGSPVKPYGVLWALVKAYLLLPPDQSAGAIHKLFDASQNRGVAPLDDIFWFS